MFGVKGKELSDSPLQLSQVAFVSLLSLPRPSPELPVIPSALETQQPGSGLCFQQSSRPGMQAVVFLSCVSAKGTSVIV